MNVGIGTCGRAVPFLGIFVSNFRIVSLQVEKGRWRDEEKERWKDRERGERETLSNRSNR